MTSNTIVLEGHTITEEDRAALQRICHLYLSSGNELENILHKEGTDEFQQMLGVGAYTRKLLGPHCKAIITETARGLFACDPEDYGVGWDIRRDGAYGERLLKSLSRVLSPSSNVLVVGAHVGTIAIPLASMCGYVAAIEPSPHNFRLLEMNIRLNNITNCGIFNVAANDKEESLKFLLNRANSGGSKRKPVNDHYIYSYDKPEEVLVPAVPLDKFFERRDFELILMDIEGSEYFALKGMQQILQHTRVLIMEFVPHHLRNISGVTVADLLDQIKGFSLLRIPSLDKKGGPAEFASLLNHMYERDVSDDGIIFQK
ncbi:FkbM family methyltransferase [Chitinophaga solisilvae]|uniref:FkbM family methyltransferase n=1 Tax=Chitinophaga solisilvae TaxID=1233460 RepID=A0A3S1D2L1_9BACT|nr:FkbM family methyltransferase [Chitinophaga solisilvae]NSL91008.1 FkbM family methyltransferase [Chitinophaga solisilvae]